MELREANYKLFRMVKAVKQGKEVRLTERGKPPAVVKLIEGHADAHVVARRLETIGLICAASKRRALPVWSARSIRGLSVSHTVMKDRAER
jgi:antitoxin (DNA-binding transcriptional repressor) of toxin-antitoxin stability system